jgi:hypothetical protein
MSLGHGAPPPAPAAAAKRCYWAAASMATRGASRLALLPNLALPAHATMVIKHASRLPPFLLLCSAVGAKGFLLRGRAAIQDRQTVEGPPVPTLTDNSSGWSLSMTIGFISTFR